MNAEPAFRHGSATTERLRPSIRRVFVCGWALLFALTGLWSLATPLGASPDEPAHMVKAASVVRGQFIGEWARTGHRVEVPQYIAFTHAQTCYAFDDTESAECVPQVSGDTDELVTSSTTAGLYNPVYYLLVGWPTLVLPDSSGVYAMRLMSALIFTGILALSFAMLAAWRRPSIPVLAAAVAITPMVFFLGSAVNPSGFEIATVFTVFVGMLSVALERTPRVSAHTTVIAVIAFFGLQARGLSPLWIAAAILIPLLLLTWNEFAGLLRNRSVQLAATVVFFGALGAIAWIGLSGSLSVITVDAAEGFVYPGTGAAPYAGFAFVLERTFEFGEGIIGVFGWLDTPAPLAVYFIWATCSGILVLAACVVLSSRRLVVALVLIIGFLVLPALVQAGYVTAGGLIWQGRYNLPMFVCLTIGLGVLVATELSGFGEWVGANRFVWILVSALAIGHLYSFATVLRRYAVGTDGTWVSTIRAPEWSAPGGNLWLLFAFAAVAAFAALALQRTTYPRASRRVPLNAPR